MSKPTVTLTLYLITSTKFAYLVSDGGDDREWIAKSCCSDVNIIVHGTEKEIEVTIPEWVAYEKNLI